MHTKISAIPRSDAITTPAVITDNRPDSKDFRSNDLPVSTITLPQRPRSVSLLYAPKTLRHFSRINLTSACSSSWIKDEILATDCPNRLFHDSGRLILQRENSVVLAAAHVLTMRPVLRMDLVSFSSVCSGARVSVLGCERYAPRTKLPELFYCRSIVLPICGCYMTDLTICVL